MKQSKYPPAELRDGPDFLSIEDFDYGWADTNIVTIMLRVSSGTFQAYATCDCATRQLCDFVDQLQKMYEFKCFNAELSAMYHPNASPSKIIAELLAKKANILRNNRRSCEMNQHRLKKL